MFNLAEVSSIPQYVQGLAAFCSLRTARTCTLCSPSVALVSEGGQTHSLFWHNWLMYSNVSMVAMHARSRG